MLRLFVERRPVRLPLRQCDSEDVCKAVGRLNPPLVVHTPCGGRFCTRRRVYFEAGDIRLECENEAELRFACRLSAEEHNMQYVSHDDHETKRMEDAVRARMEASDSEPEDVPKEEEDISLQEWEQLGYKWFKKDEVSYL